MNLKQLSFLIIAITTINCLIYAKAFDREKFVNFFKSKNNQGYISFRPVGCFRTDDEDVKVLSAPHLNKIKKQYPFKIDENTCFDIAYIFYKKSEKYDCFLVPHQVVKDFKNGQTVPVQIDRNKVYFVVKN